MATTACICGHCGRVRGGPPAPTFARAAAAIPLGEPCEAGRHLGGLEIRETGSEETVAGRTLSGLETAGTQRLFEVRGPRELHVWLAYLTWKGGEREVRRTRRTDTTWWQDRLFGRQRLAVEEWGESWLQVELGQACIDPDRTIRIADVSEPELDARSGACVRCALRLAGATAMGTRQEVLGVGDRRRHALCATFPREAGRVAVVAFALTRVAPLLSTLRARSA